MCIARSSSRLRGCLHTPPGAGTPSGNRPAGSRHPNSWTESLTHATENITLSQTSFAGGKNERVIRFWCWEFIISLTSLKCLETNIVVYEVVELADPSVTCGDTSVAAGPNPGAGSYSQPHTVTETVQRRAAVTLVSLRKFVRELS